MRQILLNLLMFGVLGGALFVGHGYSQQQAFIVFSQSYAQEVNDTYQLWANQSAYPKTRQWLNETVYQRRWEVLNIWAKQLMVYEQKLGQRTEFVRAIEKYMKAPTDFRDPEKIKFYSLELTQLMKRLPKSDFSSHKRILNFVASDLDASKRQAQEHKKISQKIHAKISQMEVAFAGHSAPETANFCSAKKSFQERQKFYADLKAQCNEASNRDASICKSLADQLQLQLNELEKEQQANAEKIRQRWPQWREPACAN